MKLFRSLLKPTKTALIIQAIGMLMGTYTHVAWAVMNGFNSENYNQPLFSRLFWDSLTFLDPLVAILLFIKPKLGVFMVLIIIISDVIHNNSIYFDEPYLGDLNITDWLTKYWMIISQIIFMLFVVITFKRNLKDIKHHLNVL